MSRSGTPVTAVLTLVVGSVLGTSTGTVRLQAQTTDAPVPVATVDGPADLVELSGATIVVAGGETVRLVDLTRPEAPTVVASHTAPDRVYGLHADAERVYLAVGLAGLQVLDARPGAGLEVLGTHETPGQAVDVSTVGLHALVVNLMTGLEVVDLTSLAAPQLLVTQETPGYQRAVTSAAFRALVVDQPTGVVLFDLEDPSAPAERATHPARPSPARSVLLDPTRPDRAYVVYDRSGEVEILDLSDVTAPRVLGAYAPGTPTTGLAVRNGVAYVTTGDQVHVVDLSDPAAPTLSQALETPGTARAIVLLDDLLVVADGDALRLFRER